jgi:CelD/BcsL family acetyltransferase involved in cellulose biosynthesis
MGVEVKLFNDLDEAARDAGGALERERQPWMFDRLSWFQMVSQYTPEGRPLVVRARNGVSQAWLFLAVRGRSGEALTNWYCLRYGLVVDPADKARAPLEDLVRGLRQAKIRRIFLEPTGEENELAAALRRKGWITRRSQVNANWRIDTRGMSFEDYWATRPSKLCNTAKRRAKANKFDIVIHDSFDAQAWQDYEEVYNASWKPAEGSPELMRRFVEQESAAGTLRLGLAYHEGKAVAGQMWTIENKVAIIHKLAYREDARHLSPGTVLSVEMFRRALDVDKAEMIDFGIGDHPYKAEWMGYKLPLYAITAYDLLHPAGVAGVVKSLASKLVARMRSLYPRS